MKVVVVGKGGREHALVRAMVESPGRPEVVCVPGSEAIHELAAPAPVSEPGLGPLVEWMRGQAVDLCVAGEEACLVEGDGLAGLCAAAGIPCWGPPKGSAQLEASKEFAKQFLVRHRIPTGRAVAVADAAAARAAIGGRFPTVLKFDGLAAGKGVAVCPDAAAAEAFLDEVFGRRRFGDGRLLVEECLTGPEVSVIAAVVDGQCLLFPAARDYKRLGDGDEGPNTGGMGAVASRRLLDPGLLARIEREFVGPTLRGLLADGLDYRGFLYFGLMLTPHGPMVIEFNCRFGDPECQAIQPLVGGDFAGFCHAGATGTLRPDLLTFRDGWSVCAVLASAGYPASSSTGDPIDGLDSLPSGATVFHAGTRRGAGGGWETNGGRVLAVVAGGPDRPTAVAAAHAAAAKIAFPGSQRRSDIGILHFQ